MFVMILSHPTLPPLPETVPVDRCVRIGGRSWRKVMVLMCYWLNSGIPLPGTLEPFLGGQEKGAEHHAMMACH